MLSCVCCNVIQPLVLVLVLQNTKVAICPFQSNFRPPTRVEGFPKGLPTTFLQIVQVSEAENYRNKECAIDKLMLNNNRRRHFQTEVGKMLLVQLQHYSKVLSEGPQSALCLHFDHRQQSDSSPDSSPTSVRHSDTPTLRQCPTLRQRPTLPTDRTCHTLPT